MPSVEEELAERLARGEEVVLATVIKLDGRPPSHQGAKLLLSRTATLAGTLGCSEFDAAAMADSAEVAQSGSPQLRTYRHDLGSIEVYVEPHAVAPTLVIFAATPVAGYLLRLAPELGFRTVLVETRPDRLEGAAWPTAIRPIWVSSTLTLPRWAKTSTRCTPITTPRTSSRLSKRSCRTSLDSSVWSAAAATRATT